MLVCSCDASARGEVLDWFVCTRFFSRETRGVVMASHQGCLGEAVMVKGVTACGSTTICQNNRNNRNNYRNTTITDDLPK